MEPAQQEDWEAVADERELHATGRALVWVKGRHVALFKIGSRIYAVDNRCPHAQGPLEDSLIETVQTEEGTHPAISCPWHHATFDLVTGEAQPGSETDQPAQVFPAKIEDGKIWLRGVTPRQELPKL